MVNFQCLAWHELSTVDLYELLALRQRVFCVEQQCPYLDCDGRDPSCAHLLGWSETQPRQLLAYARLLPPGVAYAEASIGRVVTHPSVRRTGVGRALMVQALRALNERHGTAAIRIGAQRYLERFYGSFGFVCAGESYLEDGIEHIEMLRPAGVSCP